MDIGNKSKNDMRDMLTKKELTIDDLCNQLNKHLLESLLRCCVALKPILIRELSIVNTIFVGSVIRDDIKQLDENSKTIKGAIKLKELEIKPFYLN